MHRLGKQVFFVLASVLTHHLASRWEIILACVLTSLLASVLTCAAAVKSETCSDIFGWKRVRKAEVGGGRTEFADIKSEDPQHPSTNTWGQNITKCKKLCQKDAKKSRHV